MLPLAYSVIIISSFVTFLSTILIRPSSLYG
jgi:hypothetical protein